MNINALSNVADQYIQSLMGVSSNSTTSTGGTSSTAVATATAPQDAAPQLSPFAQALSLLQQLQESDPAKYQQVTSQIASNLQTAANTATANGDTSKASELNQLANDFTSASQNNTLPNIQDLAQAISGTHRHGHHHFHLHMQSPSNSIISDTLSQAGISLSQSSGSTGS